MYSQKLPRSVLTVLLLKLPKFTIFPNLISDGPILVHTTFGDLLRSLDTPEKMNSPTNLALSREGFVVANFPGGHVVAFTANGNRLRHEIHNDHIQVKNG